VNEAKKILVGLVVTFVIGAGVIQADARWLRKVAFDEYLQQQNEIEAKKEIRSIDRDILDTQSEIQYGAVTAERKAQLEQLLQLLEQQKAELEKEVK
jgi:hypothetical protein